MESIKRKLLIIKKKTSYSLTKHINSLDEINHQLMEIKKTNYFLKITKFF